MRWIVPALCACLLVATCVQARAYLSDQPAIFGTYSKAYQERRQLRKWRAMCKAGDRQHAIAEAYAAGRPDPCQPVGR